MKKQVLTLLLALITVWAVNAQQFWTTIGSGPWQAYTTSGTPAGWPMSTGTTGWGNPIRGWGNPSGIHEFQAIKNLFPFTVSPDTSQHFVWSTTYAPTTTYYRIKYTVPQGSCKRVKIHVCSDEDRQVYVNGVLVEQNLTSAPWNEYRSVDITDKLICGDNYITARVVNASLYCLFVACLEVTNQSVPQHNMNLSYQIDCDQPNLLSLYSGTAASTVSFEWKGPNGFTSTTKDPVLTSVTKATHQGWYKCTSTARPCCKKTDSIYVVIPENCCDAEIKYFRQGCGNFVFNVSSTVVDLNCWYWTVDGAVMQNGGDYQASLTPGNHEVCVHYFGVQKKNPNIVCCNTKCVNINIPAPVEQDTAFVYCPIPGGPNGLVFNPCAFNPSTAAITRNEVWYKPATSAVFSPYYASIPGGCDELILAAGEYQVKYFDENDCLIKILHFTVTEQPITYTTCSRLVEDSCNVSISPESVTPNCIDCMDALTEATPVLVLGYNPVTQATSYVRTYINREQCRICIFTFTIASGCQANASFSVTQVSPGVFSFQNTSTGVGTFFSGQFQHIGGTPTNIHALNTTNGYLPFTHTLTPGTHTICLNVFFVRCGAECPGTKCYTITVGPDGNLLQVQGRPAPPSESGDASGAPSDKVNELKIIPNPVSSVFSIRFSDSEVKNYNKVQVLSPEGKIILDRVNASAGTQYNLSEYAAGIYYVIVHINNKVYKEKVSIIR